MAEYADANTTPQSIIISINHIHKTGGYDTYRLRIQLRILKLKSPRFGTRDINNPINNNMRDMYTLRSELPRERLRQRAESELARRESGEIGGTFETGCCAGED